jgi:dimeric dUTPase (all-alpha-NTP-PPase superfamily)
MHGNPTFYNEARFRSELVVMLRMQEAINALVFDDWAQRGLAWHRAIYVEAAELLEHLGTWKWWKKGAPDYAQAKMELVDIWHFGLAWYLERFGLPADSESLTTAVVHRVETAVAKLPPSLYVSNETRHLEIDRLVAAAGQGLFDTDAFVRLLAFCGMDFSELSRRYLGKNALNRFRQENGDKAGTYVRTWAGEQDNVHLEHILESLARDLPAEGVYEAVTAALRARYQELVPAA